jgi:hypothetical protein
MRRWTEAEDAVLMQMAAAGKSQSQAAQALDIPIGRVRHRSHLIHANFSRRGSGPKRRADWHKAQELAASGVWASKAARILGIHASQALYIARYMGFKWPQTSPTSRKTPGSGGNWEPKLSRGSVRPVRIRRGDEQADRIERMMRLAGRRA